MIKTRSMSLSNGQVLRNGRPISKTNVRSPYPFLLSENSVSILLLSLRPSYFHFDPPPVISTLTLSFRPLGEISTFGVAQQYVPSSRNSNIESRNKFKYLKTKTPVYISRHAPFETFEFWISDLFRISIFGFRVGGKGKAANRFNGYSRGF